MVQMKKVAAPFCLLAGLWLGLAQHAGSAAETVGVWPQWRGPMQTGEAPASKPPVSWSETNNVRWKTRIPGSGSSTPVIWKDRVFLTTALPAGEPGTSENGTPAYSFDVLCLNRKDGKILWRKTARQTVPHEKHHQDHGYASGSPITDGEFLFAYFGSRGLHCYDLDGNPKWSREFGKMQTRNSFGEGASPALSGETVVVNWDDESTNDFIAALDRKTGKELWRTPRNESTGWATPLIVTVGGKQQVIVNASTRVRSYELGTGKQLWECGGQTANAIPTPVAANDTVYVTSGFRGSAVMAIDVTRTGDLTGTDAVRWSRAKNTPYVPSPLLTAGLLYLVSGNNPVLTCLQTETGEPAFEAARLEGLNGIYASPVAAGGHIYVLGRNGTAVVLKSGRTLEVVSTNRLSEKTDASPAIVGSELFIRGHESLYCIAE